MLLAGREQDHITGPDLLDGVALALNPAAARRDDERLAKRMSVPCCPRAGLESYAGTLNKGRVGSLKKWIDPYSPGEPLSRSLRGRLRARSF